MSALAYLISAGILGALSSQDAGDEYRERLVKVDRTVAAEHAKLGSFLTTSKMHAWALREFRAAVRLDSDCSKARLKLGYKKDGDGEWQFDPAFPVKTRNEKKGKAATRIRNSLRKKRRKMGQRLAKKLMTLATWCAKSGRKAEAKLQYVRTIDYDPGHTKARKALGYVKRKGGGWVSPFEQRFLADAKRALGSASKGKPRAEKTSSEEKMSLSFRKLESEHFVFGSPHMSARDLASLVQHAEAAYALWHKLLRQKNLFEKEKLEFCILKTKAHHDSFVDLFDEGSKEEKQLAKDSSGWGGWPLVECYQGDETLASLQEFIIHSVVEILQQFLSLREVTNQHDPVWVYEGLALFFCRLMKGTAGWTCADLSRTGTGKQEDPKDPAEWPLILSTLVDEENDPDINGVIKCRLFSELDTAETVKAWSLIDFLLTEHHDKFVEFCKDLGTAKDNGTHSFKSVFQWTLQDLDQRWRVFARREYSGR